jgi:hypothetical protein
MPADNTRYLVDAARRRIGSLERVRAVLDHLEEHGGNATVAGVAERAGVSRTFLYDSSQAELLERLRTIRARQSSPSGPPLPTAQQVSSSSHKAIVKALRDRNQQLQKENRQLRDELAIALGQLRDLRRRRGEPSTP